MNIIIGVQGQDGMEIMGTKEGKPLIFENEELAVEFLLKETDLDKGIIKTLFVFADITEEDLTEITKAMGEMV
jgi:hypothetical protein